MIIKKRQIYILICAIAGILSMNPYFVWRTYAGGYFTYLVYLFDAFSIVCLIKLGHKIKKTNSRHLGVAVSLFAIYCLTYVHSYEGFSITTLIAGAIMFLYLFFFLTSAKEVQSEVFEMFVLLFAISVIPGIIYYAFENLGISLSIGRLYSTNQLRYADSLEASFGSGIDYYKHYIGAVMRINDNARMSGIYDEPGLVGTVSALILSARGFVIKKNRINIMLLLTLLLSFSLAGYVIAISYFIIRWLREKQWRLVIFSIIVIIFIGIVLNVQSDNAAILALQKRVSLNENGISFVNNRVTSNYFLGFSEILRSSLTHLLFGFGKSAATFNRYMAGSSIYLDYVYNFGFLGFPFMVISLVSYYCQLRIIKLARYYWAEFALLCVFLLSIYQRPAVFFPYYFIILFGGQAYIRLQSSNKANNINHY